MTGPDISDVRAAVVRGMRAFFADIDGDDVPCAGAYGHIYRDIIAEAAVDIAVIADALHRKGGKTCTAGHQPVVKRTRFHIADVHLHRRK